MIRNRFLCYGKYVSLLHIVVIWLIAFSFWSCHRMDMGVEGNSAVVNQTRGERSKTESSNQACQAAELNQQLQREQNLAKEIGKMLPDLIQVVPVNFLFKNICPKYAIVGRIAGSAIVAFGMGTLLEICYAYLYDAVPFSALSTFPSTAVEEINSITNRSMGHIEANMMGLLHITTRKPPKGVIEKIGDFFKFGQTEEDIIQYTKQYISRLKTNLSNYQSEIVNHALNETYHQLDASYRLHAQAVGWGPLWMQVGAIGGCVTLFNICYDYCTRLWNTDFLKGQSHEVLSRLVSTTVDTFRRARGVCEEDMEKKARKGEQARENLKWLCRGICALTEDIQSSRVNHSKITIIQDKLNKLLSDITSGNDGIYGDIREQVVLEKCREWIASALANLNRVIPGAEAISYAHLRNADSEA